MEHMESEREAIIVYFVLFNKIDSNRRLGPDEIYDVSGDVDEARKIADSLRDLWHDCDIRVERRTIFGVVKKSNSGEGK